MKKVMKNNVLKTAAFLFAASFAFGMGAAVSANADEGSPLDSFTLVDGASVRYGAEDGKNGLRYTIAMDKTDYESLAAEGYTDVTFGVLIAPEHYNDIYALNEENVFGANAKYCWDGEQAGKAEIFNLRGSLVEDPLDESKMTFYGAVVDILDGDPVGEANNVALDFRGVGYVKYTYNNEVCYKFVGDEDNVRSMAYVAQETIALPNADATMSADLQAAYLDKVDWALKAENAGSETLDVATMSAITVPTSVKALDNTFYTDKYDVAWTFAGSAVEAGQTIAMPKLSGSYTLTATATRKTNADDQQVVYTKTFTVNAPLLNNIPSTYTYGAYTYDVNTGLYATAVSNTAQYLVDTVTDGDYVVEATITGLAKSGFGYMPGIAINAGGAERIAFKSLSGSNNLWINVSDSEDNVSECYVTNFGAGIGGVGATMGIKVARVNNVFYVYNKSGAFMFAMDSTGIYPNGTSQVGFDNSDYNTSTMATLLGQFFAKGNENIVGTYTNPYSGTAEYSYNITMTKGTETAASYAIGNATVNGLATTMNTGSAVYTGSGMWKNADTETTTRQYYLNTIVRGDTDFVLQANTEVLEKSNVGGWTGVSLGFAKGDRETSSDFAYGKANVDFKINNWDAQSAQGKILTIYCDRGDGYGMTIQVKGFNTDIGAVGCKAKMTIVRLGDIMYIYDNTDTLVCTMTPDGVYGATEANVVTYSGQDQSWYATNVGYSIFKGAPECVAGMYYEKYGVAYGRFQTALTMTRGTTAANNKVNPTA